MKQSISRPIIRGTIASLDKKYRIDRKEASKAAAKAIGASASFGLGMKTGALTNPNFLPGIVGSLFEAAASFLSSVKVEDSAEARLWRLVRNSLDLAWLSITKDVLQEQKSDFDNIVTAVSTSLDASIQQQEVVIDKDFFETPESLPIISTVQDSLHHWLVSSLNLSSHVAQNYSSYLPAAFVSALRALSALDPSSVEALKQRVATHFDSADERLRARATYAARLEAELLVPLFDAPASLRDLYQPLKAYWIREREKPNHDDLDDDANRIIRYREERVIVELEENLDHWFSSSTNDDQIRIISGGPGSGKSSFAKWWTWKMASRGHRVLLVPLHRLDTARGPLRDRIDSFARIQAGLAEDPLDSVEPLLLVLDGLDELIMQGRSGLEAAETLVRDIEQLVGEARRQNRRLLALIGGREVLVDRLKNRLNLRAILHLLPYRMRINELADYRCAWFHPDGNEIKGDEEAFDLRENWWEAWGRATGEELEGVPVEIERRRELSSLTDQPLLNFLLALSRRMPGSLPTANSVNAVYAKLLKDVWGRRWGSEGHENSDGRLEIHKTLDFDEFERVFQAMAVAAWRSGTGRAITTSAIKEALQQENLLDQLASIEAAGQEGSLRLLTAFYWREVGVSSSGERAWELTHKSFGEYLIARRVSRLLKRIALMRERNKLEIDNGWTTDRALSEWSSIVGRNILDSDLASMIMGELSLVEHAEALKLQLLVEELLTWYVRNGIAMRHEFLFLAMKDVIQQVENSGVGLIICYGALARKTRIVSQSTLFGLHDSLQSGYLNTNGFISLATGKINKVIWGWAKSHRFSTGRGMHSIYSSCERTDLLSYMNFSGLSIWCEHFSDQELIHTSFSGCRMTYCVFVRAYCRYVDFTRVALEGCNFGGADLSNAKLAHAGGHTVNFRDANLTDADLSHICFQGADFRNANLTGADLKGADLRLTSGLTLKQLRSAKNSEKAMLPRGLQVVLGATSTNLV